MTTGPEFVRETSAELTSAFESGTADRTVTEAALEKIATLLSGMISGQQAQLAAFLMFVENREDYPPYEMDAWREVIPRPPLKECKAKDVRRPQCAERHTEDCDYAEPPPEPKHVLLNIGTRVLVSPLHDPDCTCASTQPYVGKIAGYDMSRSKYQINEERYGTPGEYYNFVKWESVSNRVEIHPDGPVYVADPAPEPVKREPTGPRVYVQNQRGKQGHVVEFGRKKEDQVAALVQWYAPGARPVWRSMDLLTIVHPDDVARCENGQTGDECGEGENQCELCLADADAEARLIEESMGR